MMNKIFEHLYKKWVDLEKAIEHLPTNKEKGDAFEEFVHSSMIFNAGYKDKFSIWLDDFAAFRIELTHRRVKTTCRAIQKFC